MTSLFNVTGTAYVRIGGSREGNAGGITGKEQASFFGIPASAYVVNAYRYYCEGPHTLYYNHRHALLFLSLSQGIIKNAPQNQQPDTAYDFSNIKKTGRNMCESPIHQKASNKISSKSGEKQRSYSNFSNGWKSWNFWKFLLPGPPIFDFFRFFIVILKVRDERNRMAFVPSKSAS